MSRPKELLQRPLLPLEASRRRDERPHVLVRFIVLHCDFFVVGQRRSHALRVLSARLARSCPCRGSRRTKRRARLRRCGRPPRSHRGGRALPRRPPPAQQAEREPRCLAPPCHRLHNLCRSPGMQS
eukprot:scaffold5171_cov126-Isochrysis_galbana.AAC.5